MSDPRTLNVFNNFRFIGKFFWRVRKRVGGGDTRSSEGEKGEKRRVIWRTDGEGETYEIFSPWEKKKKKFLFDPLLNFQWKAEVNFLFPPPPSLVFHFPYFLFYHFTQLTIQNNFLIFFRLRASDNIDRVVFGRRD